MREERNLVSLLLRRFYGPKSAAYDTLLGLFESILMCLDCLFKAKR